jgi:hypothetical protein
MADTDLPVRRLIRILSALGAQVEFTRNGFIKAVRTLPDKFVVCWMQHCHRGIKDTIPRHTVRVARRTLRLLEADGTTDDRFYSFK